MDLLSSSLPSVAADQKIRLSVCVAYLENFGKMVEGKTHGYAHLDMARATCLKLVMRHFAPSPTSDARRCWAAAACGLRRALRAAAMRLCASCRFTSLKSTVFTFKNHTVTSGQEQVCRSTERAVLKSKRNGAGREWDETDDGVVERVFRTAR